VSLIKVHEGSVEFGWTIGVRLHDARNPTHYTCSIGMCLAEHENLAPGD
jgi:hypothetical protein